MERERDWDRDTVRKREKQRESKQEIFLLYRRKIIEGGGPYEKWNKNKKVNIYDGCTCTPYFVHAQTK